MTIRRLTVLLLLACAVFSGVNLYAEDAYAMWKRANEARNLGQTKRNAGDLAEAQRLYSVARETYVQVKEARPDWSTEMLDQHIALCDNALLELAPLLENAPDRRADSEPAAAVPDPALRSELAETKEKLFRALLEVDDLRRQVQNHQSCEVEIASLIGEKRVLSEEIAQNRLELETLRTRLKSPDSEREEQNRQLLQLQMHIEQLERTIRVYEANAEKLTNERADAYVERNQARAEARTAGERQEALNREIERLNAKLKSSEESSQRADGRQKDLALEVDRLTRELARKNADYDGLLEQVNLLAGGDDAGETLAGVNESQKKKYDELLSDYNRLNSEYLKQRDQFRDLNMELTRATDMLQRVDADAKVVRLDLKDLQERFDANTKALELSRVSETQAKERSANLESQNHELAGENRTLRERLEARETNDLESTLKRNEEIQSLRDSLARRGQEIAALEEQKKAQAEKLTAAEQDFAELRQDYIDAKARLMSAELELKQLGQAPAQLAERDAAHAAEVTELNRAVAERDGLIAERDQAIAALEAAVAELKDARTQAATVEIVTVPATRPAARPSARSLSAEEIAAGLESARMAIDNLTPELAVWEYQRILKYHPDNYDANYGLALLRLEDQRYREAAGLVDQVYRQRPDAPDAVALYCRYLAGTGQAGAALKLADENLEKHPGNLELELAAGRSAAAAGDWNLAVSHYARVINSGTAPPALQVELVYLLLAIERNDDAARLYESARNAGARPDPEIENALGTHLPQNRELSRFLQQAGDEALANGDYDSAAWYLGQLIDLDPRVERWNTLLSYVELQRGDAVKAVEALNRASGQTANPTSEVTMLRLALSAAGCLTGREPDRAAEQFDRLYELNNRQPYTPPPGFEGLPELARERAAQLSRYPELEQAAVQRALAACSQVFPSGEKP